MNCLAGSGSDHWFVPTIIVHKLWKIVYNCSGVHDDLFCLKFFISFEFRLDPDRGKQNFASESVPIQIRNFFIAGNCEL